MTIRNVRDFILCLLFGAVFGILLIGAFLPEVYGNWLLKVDNARFSGLDVFIDATESTKNGKSNLFE